MPDQSSQPPGASRKPPPAPRVDAPAARFVALYASGKSISAVAKETGFTSKVVRARLIEAGVKMRSRCRPSGFPGADALVELYVTRRLSVREAGAVLGVTGTTIRYWLEQAGIERRTVADGKAGQKPARHTVEASVRARRKHVLPDRPVVGYKHRADGYVDTWDADRQKYEREHRIVLGKKLGRPLKRGEIAHHKNQVRSDNHPKNLRKFKSVSAHMKHHARERLAAGRSRPR